MSCPNCNSEEVEMTNKKTDGQGYWEKEEYSCSNCGCEWEWEMTKTIIEQGEEQ